MELFVNGESVGVDTFTASSTNPIGSGTSGAAYYGVQSKIHKVLLAEQIHILLSVL